MILSAGFQAQGSRKEQQDSYGILEKKDKSFISHAGVLAVVADGMGGLAQGREASQLAVKSFISAYKMKKPDESVDSALLRSLHACNKEVFQFSESQDLEGKLGTTIVAAVIQDNNLNWISVGDSRIHLIQQNEITCLTTDHNYESQLNELLAKGEITKEEVISHPQSAALTSFVGGEDISIIGRNTSPIKCFDTDQVMLSSDGLYSRLTDKEIISITNKNPGISVKELINKKLGMKAKNQDNLTAVILQKKDKAVPKTNNVYAAVSLLTIIGLFIFLAIDKPFSTTDQYGVAADLEIITNEKIEKDDPKVEVKELQDNKAEEVAEVISNEAEEDITIAEAQLTEVLPKESKIEINTTTQAEEAAKGITPAVLNKSKPIKEEIITIETFDVVEDNEVKETYKTAQVDAPEEKPASIEINKDENTISPRDGLENKNSKLLDNCEQVKIGGTTVYIPLKCEEAIKEEVYIAKPEDVVIVEEKVKVKPRDRL